MGMHWLFAFLAFLAFHTDWFGQVAKGQPTKLIEDGEVNSEAMRQEHLSKKDLEEALRLGGQVPEPESVKLAFLERDGSISVVPRSGEPRVLEVAVEDGVQVVRIRVE